MSRQVGWIGRLFSRRLTNSEWSTSGGMLTGEILIPLQSLAHSVIATRPSSPFVFEG
jgi:hypothetical protein